MADKSIPEIIIKPVQQIEIVTGAYKRTSIPLRPRMTNTMNAIVILKLIK